jgi:hypothetical protein
MSAAFDPLTVDPMDRNVLEGEIAAALKAPNTSVFLDTNILIWMYGLHRAARTEFCDWLTNGPLKGRIHIPRRVIHEFSAHRNDQNKLYPFGREFRGSEKTLKHFEQAAPLVVDDALASSNGFTDRATYMSNVGSARELVAKLVGTVTSSNENLTNIHAQLIPIFNGLALKTDIFSGLAALQQAYEARAELRLQPGFMDAKKGRAQEEENVRQGVPAKSGANRFGDLAIWEEILTFVKAQVADGAAGPVLLLTHDGKTNWSYYPNWIIDRDGHTKPNTGEGAARLAIAQPLLAHELKLRTGASALYILSIHQLAAIANGHDAGFSFGELARAVQVEAEEQVAEQETLIADADVEAEAGVTTDPAFGAGNGGGANQDDTAATEQEPQAAAADAALFLAQPPESGLADATYVTDPDGPPAMDEAIKKLRSHNWYSQNPAVRAGLEILRAGRATLLQSFVFGRNLYQAAVGSSIEATNLIENLAARLSMVDAGQSAALYGGALFELYFDSRGDLRKQPKSSLVDSLLRHQQNEPFAPAIDFIRTRLHAAGARLLITPSFDKPVRQLAIEQDDEGRIAAIRLDSVVLTQPWQDGAGGAPLPPRVDYHRLQTLAANAFSAPVDQVALTPMFEGLRDVAGIQVSSWNPVDGPDLS